MNADSNPPTSPRRSFTEVLVLWVNRVRYMALSGLIHAILVLVLGGTVLYRTTMDPPDFTSGGDGLIMDESLIPELPEALQIQNPDLASSSTASSAASATSAATEAASQMAALTTTAITPNNFRMASISAPEVSVNIKQSAPTAVPASTVVGMGLSKGQASRIGEFTGRWSKGGKAAMGQPLKSRAFEFTAYLAKYSGGDWDSTVWLDGENVRGGGLHNLLYIISRMSHKKIHADPQPIPLDLSSQEIFEKRPPSSGSPGTATSCSRIWKW